MNFGDRLKKARESAGLSQSELARLVDTKKQNIAAYEQGRAQPNNKLLVNISKALNVTIEWLTTGGGETNFKIPEHVTIWKSQISHITEEEKRELDKFIRELLAEADEENRKNAMDVARVILKKGKKKKEK
ncbi:MAG: helix-turn-helix domain-containing protein [Bacteroidota bacterium]